MNREIPEDAYKALAYLRTYCESMEKCKDCPFVFKGSLLDTCGLHITDPSGWDVNMKVKYEFNGKDGMI